MASWDPLSMAQDVIRCSLCEDAPAELNCNTCHVGLCDDCVSKHITSKKSRKHDIVPFTSKESEIRLPECQTHLNTKCDLHCRQCHSAVCSKCVASGSHKSHDLSEISDVIASKRESIKKETTELETLIQEEYEKIKTETKTKISKVQKEYQSLRQLINDHGKQWHKDLDVVIDTLIKNIDRMEQEDLATLNKQLDEMEKILTNIRNESKKNKEILNSTDSSKIITHISKNRDFLNVPARVELSPPTFTAISIDIKQLSKQFGTLTSSIKTELSEYKIKMKESISSLTSVTQLLDVPTEVNDIDTGGNIVNMTTVNTDQMWIGRVGCIDRVDIYGTILESINTHRFIPLDLTTTTKGHLIYTDVAVNLVRKGKIQTVIRAADWSATSVCSTSNGDLLVCLRKNKERKVVRYSGYKVKQEIQHDEKNKPLFLGDSSLYIAENRDQNICVSDSDAHTVLVLNPAGKLQFRYDGNLASNKYKSFDPRGIATDSHSQILIADVNNKCVHIINRDGKFLRYIDNCHLDKPYYLSVDRFDRLFVLHSSSSVKVIKYMK